MTKEQAQKRIEELNQLTGYHAQKYYDEDNGYYAISNVDYLGEIVTLMYIFEDEKLASIWIAPTYDSYKNVYNMALEICKEDGLPVSFFIFNFR